LGCALSVASAVPCSDNFPHSSTGGGVLKPDNTYNKDSVLAWVEIANAIRPFVSDQNCLAALDAWNDASYVFNGCMPCNDINAGFRALKGAADAFVKLAPCIKNQAFSQYVQRVSKDFAAEVAKGPSNTVVINEYMEIQYPKFRYHVKCPVNKPVAREEAGKDESLLGIVDPILGSLEPLLGSLG